MILTIDIGNSRIKWAAWQDDHICSRGAAAYVGKDLAAVFEQLFTGLEMPSQIFAACVAGDDLRQALDQWVKQRWNLGVDYLKTAKQYKNIINAYDEPGQHGVDRWAAVVAGYQHFPGYSVCVISAGTAITFDLVNQDGKHLGGFILPSYDSMHAGLVADTVNVEAVADTQFREQGIPVNTEDAVNQGLHRFIRAGIRELCQLAQDKLDEPMKIILTGGFAETIFDYPDMPKMHHEPELVMLGLYAIMKQKY